MDSILYNAAISGDIDVLVHYNDMFGVQVTPNNSTVLHLASQWGKIQCVLQILSMHPRLLSKVNSRGETPLHLAARNGHSRIVKALIECAQQFQEGVESAKETLRMTNNQHDMALHEAVRYDHLDVVTLLTQEDPEFPHFDNDLGETPLYIAAEKGYVDVVLAILQTCTSPRYSGPVGRTALHGAVISESEGSIRELVQWKRSLCKEMDEDGRTPLHYAAFIGYASGASLLLCVDQSVAYIVDKFRNTPLHMAASQGNIKVMEKLISCCPDCCEMVNGKGQNILHIAVEHEQKRTIEYILSSKSWIKEDNLIIQKDAYGNTPFHLIATSNCYVPTLLWHPLANNRVLNEENLSPLDIITQNEDRSTVAERGHLENELNFADRWLNTPRKAWKKDRDQRLKKAAKTQVIVAALIATVTFTAGFTLPGGFNQNESESTYGMANLTREAAFKVFILADTIALLLSTIAIVIYFAVPSHFESFTASMENKEADKAADWYLAATYIVFVAIGAMMVAFVTGTYAVLAHSSTLAIAICAVAASSFLIIYLIMEKLLRVIQFLFSTCIYKPFRKMVRALRLLFFTCTRGGARRARRR